MNSKRHIGDSDETSKALSAKELGLTAAEAQRRLKERGPNSLPQARADTLLIIFLRQFQSPLIYILLGASLAVFAMGEITDGSIILCVLIFNAIVGTIQEGKAQNTLLALKKFVETTAVVLREGKELIIPDVEVVEGDIVILQEGEKVPADARVTLAHNLKLDEAALTGESEPVHKIADTIEHVVSPSSDKKSLVFKGTNIVAGNGAAVVIATGPRTTIGTIAREIATIDTEIPLKANIRYLSRFIIAAVASICTGIFLLGLLSGKPTREMFATVVSLAVSIIPEGLPIVVTLILATGVWRMSKRHALVKRLQAVEALGQARIIAVDKTGTITKNEMVVQRVYVDNELFDITGVGYEPKGDVRLRGGDINPTSYPELLFMGQVAARCANARVMLSEQTQQWRVAGDPTEAAMVIFSQKLGLRKSDLEQESPLIAEIPFDYKLKYHAVVYQNNGQQTLAVAGAPEVILKLSQRAWHGGKSQPLGKNEVRKLESVFIHMSGEGIRVVALATKNNVPETLGDEGVTSLTFVGFLGMRDALRPEVSESLQRATAAGIRVVMITGDNKITARAIATEAGIYHPGDAVLTGQEIDTLSEFELSQKLPETSVFARVTPEHKLQIIKAYKARGEIIAMTGDGVNDAPSLVAADLGVAMGRIGTEVAKEASDIVLLDDNFGSIVSAVEDGRAIYKTIKKVILYLFSTSLGEVFTITGALLLGYGLPILPAQIIWLNFVTDGFLDVSLAMEPKEAGLLRRSFERPKKYLVDRLMIQRMVVMSIPMAAGAIFIFNRYFGADLAKAWTVSLTVLAAFQWFNAWNCRSENKSVFQMNPLSNKFLAVATLVVIGLQLLAVYHPLMQRLLHTVPLQPADWFVIVIVALSIVVVEEVRKLAYRSKGSVLSQ